MREYLQGWYDGWLKEHENTDLIYAGAGRERPSLGQVHFVRDVLGQLVWTDVKYEDRPREQPRADCRVTAMVIGEHRSKSVRLPVYSLERPDLGIQFVLRDNYHDWNVSVVSEKPVEANLRGFELDFRSDEHRKRHQPEGSWNYCFFQGFPSEFCFGPYSMDRRRFSLSMTSDYALFTFVWLVMQGVRSAP